MVRSQNGKENIWFLASGVFTPSRRPERTRSVLAGQNLRMPGSSLGRAEPFREIAFAAFLGPSFGLRAVGIIGRRRRIRRGGKGHVGFGP